MVFVSRKEERKMSTRAQAASVCAGEFSQTLMESKVEKWCERRVYSLLLWPSGVYMIHPSDLRAPGVAYPQSLYFCPSRSLLDTRKNSFDALRQNIPSVARHDAGKHNTGTRCIRAQQTMPSTQPFISSAMVDQEAGP